MSRPPPQPEDTIHLLAARQHGLVTRSQLVDIGLAPHTLDYRVKRGRLRPIHRGVYQIGGIYSPAFSSDRARSGSYDVWGVGRRGDPPQGARRDVDGVEVGPAGALWVL